MAHLDDEDEELVIFDGIQDPVASLSDPVFVLPREFFASWGSGILSELQKAFDNPLAVLFQRDGFDFFDRGGLDQQPIFCHAASSPGGRPQRAG